MQAIGVVTAAADHAAEQEIIRGVTDAAQVLGYHTVVLSNIFNFGENGMEQLSEHQIYDLIRSPDLAGIILLTESFADVRLKARIAGILKERDIPVIAVGAEIPEFADIACRRLNTNDAADLERLTAHLIEVHGFTAIDLLTGPADSGIAGRRRDGFLHAIRSHQVPAEQCRVHYGDFWLNSGTALAERYISGELSLPQAIVCASCHMAFALLKRFFQAGIRVPEQVSVVTYEYSDERALYAPLLTCMKRQGYALGKQAVTEIVQLLRGETPPPYRPPAGELIFGESCSCQRDDVHYLQSLRAAQQMHDQVFFTVYNTMEQRAVECRSVEELTAVIGEYHWMIRGARTVTLCLFENWYETGAQPSGQVTCFCLTPWDRKAPVKAKADALSVLMQDASEPSVFYIVPLFLRTHLMGHLVMRYDHAGCYDGLFYQWMKAAALALEYLRIKNDMRYLLRCQSLSETREPVTGLYSEAGLRNLYGAFAEISGESCFMAVIRICLFSEPLSGIRQEEHLCMLRAAAEGIRKLCGSRHFAGCSARDNTFICLFQNGQPKLTLDTICAVLMQTEAYIAGCGADSFAGAAVYCSGRRFDEVYRQCICRIAETEAERAECRNHSRYHTLLDIRNSCYLHPADSFSQISIPSFVATDLDSFRHAYKKAFGISFQQDRIRARIAKAMYLLITTELHITEIAEQCGYADSKYFLRQFAAQTGMTPRSYRSLFAEN